VPHVAARDPYALRGLVLVLWSRRSLRGGERTKRIAAAFDWHGVVTPANSGSTPGSRRRPTPAAAADPAGLRPASNRRPAKPGDGAGRLDLVVRATGQSGLDVAVKGASRGPAEAKPQAPKGTEERHFTITAAGTATVRGGGDRRGLDLQCHSDRPADHRAAKEPEPAAPRLAAAQLQG
jgi:hypothetical protein